MGSIANSDLPIVWKGEKEYEELRTRTANSNKPADRFPLAVVRPTKVEHVVEAVKLAEQHGARIALRGGGHSFSAWSIRNNSILLDMANLKHLTYDEKTQIMEAAPSTMGGQILAFLRPKGRYVPVGHCATVGMGGFILQGGMGLHANALGYACEHLVGIDVVTAKGEVLHADKNNHSDLFWAARGAGPGFPAIVTRFYLNTLEAFKASFGDIYAYPIKEYDAVTKWVLGINKIASPNTEIVVMYDNRQQTRGGYCALVVLTTFGETEKAAKAELQRWRDTAPPGAWDIKTDIPDGYLLMHKLSSADEDAKAAGMPIRFTGLNCFLKDDCDFLEVCREPFTTLPRGTWAYWEPMAPHSNEKIEDMAFTMNFDRYVAIYTSHQREEDDEYFNTWLQKQMEPLLPYSEGAYLGDACMTRQPTKYWSTEAGKKLMAIRRKWNPDGRICGYMVKGDPEGLVDLPNKLAQPESVFPRTEINIPLPV